MSNPEEILREAAEELSKEFVQPPTNGDYVRDDGPWYLVFVSDTDDIPFEGDGSTGILIKYDPSRERFTIKHHTFWEDKSNESEFLAKFGVTPTPEQLVQVVKQSSNKL